MKNKCLSKQSLSTVEIKGSLSLPDRIILNTDVSLIFKIDQGFEVCVIPRTKSHTVFEVR